MLLNSLRIPDIAGKIADGLTELLRQGARRLIHEAVEAELEAFLEQHRERHDNAGRQAIVRNGYLPEREVLSGVGPVSVKVPRVRDRSGEGTTFHSALLPPYLRKTKSVDSVLLWLYLKGISTGAFDEALSTLFGGEVKGLSASAIGRLKSAWEDEYVVWQRKALDTQRFVYLWADGVYLNVRLEDAKQCVLVVIGVDEHGFKHFLAIEDGYRESTQSWREVLQGLKSRGLEVPPELAVGDGALGFWTALAQVYPSTRAQRCWVHKTANVLNRLPKGTQAKAKEALMAPSREAAQGAFEAFVNSLRGEISPGGRVAGKGSRRAVGVLRFPGCALAAYSHDQSDRIELRDGATSHAQDQELSVAQDWAGNGLQACDERSEGLAATARIPTTDARDRRGEVHRRCRCANH